MIFCYILAQDKRKQKTENNNIIYCRLAWKVSFYLVFTSYENLIQLLSVNRHLCKEDGEGTTGGGYKVVNILKDGVVG